MKFDNDVGSRISGYEDRIMSGMEVRQGEAWPLFGECEGVFISFKLFSPADGHP